MRPALNVKFTWLSGSLKYWLMSKLAGATHYFWNLVFLPLCNEQRVLFILGIAESKMSWLSFICAIWCLSARSYSFGHLSRKRRRVVCFTAVSLRQTAGLNKSTNAFYWVSLDYSRSQNILRCSLRKRVKHKGATPASPCKVIMMDMYNICQLL